MVWSQKLAVGTQLMNQRKKTEDYKKERKKVGHYNELRNTSVNNKKIKRKRSLRNIRKKESRI